MSDKGMFFAILCAINTVCLLYCISTGNYVGALINGFALGINTAILYADSKK